MKQKVKLLIERNGRLLLLKPLNKSKFTFVGGTVNKGETPIFAGIREGFEEAGLSLSYLDFINYFSTYTIIKNKSVTFYCYLIKKEGLTFELREHHKFDSLGWVSVADGIDKLKGIEKFSAAFFNTVLFQKQWHKKPLKQVI
ncbi:MAG: NUDIX hydrolase [Crocinitomix sp.]|nr:NUDIX hydrolase [Crocinitomix sp.]